MKLLKGGRILADKYQITKKLKTGGFASVFIGRGVKPDQNRYAIKLMSRKNERYANV